MFKETGKSHRSEKGFVSAAREVDGSQAVWPDGSSQRVHTEHPRSKEGLAEWRRSPQYTPVTWRAVGSAVCREGRRQAQGEKGKVETPCRRSDQATRRDAPLLAENSQEIASKRRTARGKRAEPSRRGKCTVYSIKRRVLRFAKSLPRQTQRLRSMEILLCVLTI